MATSPDIVEIINTSLENLKQSTESITDFSSANTVTLRAINAGISKVKDKVDDLTGGITRILAAKNNIETEIGKIKDFPKGIEALNVAIDGLEKVDVNSLKMQGLNKAVDDLRGIVIGVKDGGIGPAPSVDTPGAGAGAGAPGAPPAEAGAGRGGGGGGGKRNTKGGYIINSHKKKSYSRRSRRSSRPKRGRLSKTRKSTKSKK